MHRVLHLLSQRPSLTGSGVTLDALIRNAAESGWEQAAAIGVPAADAEPAVGGLAANRIHPLRFESESLPFPVPGMSDVMPYRSTRWSEMGPEDLDRYRGKWAEHLRPVLERFAPDVIHAHHVWILGSLIKDLAPSIPVVSHCHATGLRQMELCPHLAEAVRRGCRRNDRFAVLHSEHADRLRLELGLEAGRIIVVGAGYREDLFHQGGRTPGTELLFIGKYAHAKGLPSLLDAFDQLREARPDWTLHVAGSGAGPEAEALRQRMEAMAPHVVLHGQVDQERLAELMRAASVCILPSFYEGLPLALVEALACGCRLVTTDLPGVIESIAPKIPAECIEIVPRPRLSGPDSPVEADLPAFTKRLAAAIERSMSAPPVGPVDLKSFTWRALFHRVERIWRELIVR